MAMETMQTAMHAKKKENEKNSYYGSGSVHIASSFSPSGGWHIEFLTLCCCCCYNNNDVMLTYSLWSNVNTLPLHCRYTAATLSIPVYEKRIARHFSFCNTGPIRLASDCIWHGRSHLISNKPNDCAWSLPLNGHITKWTIHLFARDIFVHTESEAKPTYRFISMPSPVVSGWWSSSH